MIKQMPKIFALTLLYKVGSLAYANSSLSTRNNRNTMDEEAQIPLSAYYEGLYRQRLKGTATLKGLSSVISNFINKTPDNCVICNSTKSIAYAIG